MIVVSQAAVCDSFATAIRVTPDAVVLAPFVASRRIAGSRTMSCIHTMITSSPTRAAAEARLDGPPRHQPGRRDQRPTPLADRVLLENRIRR